MRLQPNGERVEFVLALELQALREVAAAHHLDDLHQLVERMGDRLQEVVRANERERDGREEAREHHDLGVRELARDRRHRGVRGSFLVVDDHLDRGARLLELRAQLFAPELVGALGVELGAALENLALRVDVRRRGIDSNSANFWRSSAVAGSAS